MPTRGASFAETTRARRRMGLWSLGETRTWTFWNSLTFGDVGVRMLCGALRSCSIFFRIL
jgi:hypothetical protein